MKATVKTNLSFKSSTTMVSDTLADYCIQEGAIVVATAATAKFMIDTIITTDGEWIYEYDTTMSVITDAMFKIDNLIISIDEAPFRSFARLYTNPVENPTTSTPDPYSNLPTHYDWREGYVFLYPPSITEDTLLLFGYGVPESISTDTTLLTQVAVNYRTPIEEYATYKLAMKLGMFDKATVWYGAFEKSMERLGILKFHNYIVEKGDEK